MYPPIFATLSADPDVQAVLGSAPTRVYPFGTAPQGVAYPYAVWRLVSGSPENYLAGRPDLDSFTLQVDVYAKTGGDAIRVATAIRDAVELKAHITRWGDHDTDPGTGSRHIGFDIDWWVKRPA